MAFPRSLWFFAIMGVAYALQRFPYTGFVLMFLLGPYWSIFLINLGFIGIAVEAIKKLVSRNWLILPIVYFGGYAGFAFADHMALWGLQRDVASTNAKVRFPFDPARQALVAIGDGVPLDWLVQHYGLPVAYQRIPGDRHRATRLVAKSVCRRVGADSGMQAAGIYTFGIQDDRRFDDRFCLLTQPEDPAVPTVAIGLSEQRRNIEGIPITERSFVATFPDRSHATLRVGMAEPLAWFPIPFVGCMQNTFGSPWFCVHQFSRQTVPLWTDDDRTPSEPAALAEALGLVRVAPADRQAGDSRRAQDDAAAAERRIVSNETAQLDRVLAAEWAEIGDVPFNGLRGRLDIILPRLDRIVAAVERGVARQGRARDNAQQMFHLIEQAPPDALAPYRARIDALRTKDSWFVFEPEDG